MKKLLLVLSIIVSGCSSTGVLQVGSTDYSSRASNCSLDIYSSREDIKKEFEAICVITSESGSTLLNDRSQQGRLNVVKRKACECGADALVLTRVNRTATRWGQGYAQAQVSAEAIVYK